MSEQLFISPGGERLVILPESDFLRMQAALEDRADADAVREFENKRAAGTEELIPDEFVNRMIDGENLVSVWRDYRGFSAKALAEKAGISAPYLSEIENGKKEGSLSVMKKLADALRVTVDDLV